MAKIHATFSSSVSHLNLYSFFEIVFVFSSSSLTRIKNFKFLCDSTFSVSFIEILF